MDFFTNGALAELDIDVDVEDLLRGYVCCTAPSLLRKEKEDEAGAGFSFTNSTLVE